MSGGTGDLLIRRILGEGLPTVSFELGAPRVRGR